MKTFIGAGDLVERHVHRDHTVAQVWGRRDLEDVCAVIYERSAPVGPGGCSAVLARVRAAVPLILSEMQPDSQ